MLSRRENFSPVPNKKNFCFRVKRPLLSTIPLTKLNFWKKWFQKDAKSAPCSLQIENPTVEIANIETRENIHTRGEDKENWKRVFNRIFR